jgi:hypothetical protein
MHPLGDVARCNHMLQVQRVNDGEGQATLYEAVLHPSVVERMAADADFKAELVKVCDIHLLCASNVELFASVFIACLVVTAKLKINPYTRLHNKGRVCIMARPLCSQTNSRDCRRWGSAVWKSALGSSMCGPTLLWTTLQSAFVTHRSRKRP